MLSNVILSIYLQHADHTDLATLPIGVKGRRKEKKRKEEKKRAVPRAAAAFGRQLISEFIINNMYLISFHMM